jgi:hypothetical protein
MDNGTRAERAKRIQEDQVFQDALEDAAYSIFERWKASDNASEREALWHQYKALDALPEQLRIYVGRGAHEEKRK